MISSLASRFEFSKRRGLFLSAHKAATYQWQQGKLGRSYLFDVTEEGRAHFERYLQETENAPLHILLDVFEEDFRREKIPHVFGSDRVAIIKRRQERLFRNTPYCYHEIQGREASGRRDDRVLLTAITDTKLIAPWLALLDKYQVPLAGIHSVSLLTGALLKLIPEPAARMLIVSLQSVSGLRQTFYLNKEIKISRLVQMPRYGTEPYAPYIFREVEKISRYINSLQLGNKNEPLHIYFLATGELLQELKQEYTNSAELHHHCVDLNTLATKNALKTVSTPFSDQFFMHELLARPLGNCYATPSNTRYFSMRRLRHLMLASSVLLLISSAIWGGYNLVTALSYKQRSLSAQSKAQFYEAQNQTARERLPQLPVQAADLQLAVELSATLRDYKTTPLETIQLISSGLNQLSSIHVSDIQWGSSLDPDFNAGQNESAANTQNIATYRNVNFNEADYRFYQVSIINGYIEPFDGDFREAISLINEFAAFLRRQKSAYDVSIISLPLDISSNSNLQGDMKATGKPAMFSMRIVLGTGDEK